MLVRVKLTYEDSVLIIDGMSNLGQASISIALQIGCKVFTTVENTDIQTLTARFPKLNKNHITGSVDEAMINLILNYSNQEGVKLVLNPTEEDHVYVLRRCLALDGVVLNVTSESHVLHLFQKSKHNNNLMEVFMNNPSSRAKVSRLFNDGVASGVVKPLSANVFNRDEIKKAFRSFPEDNKTGKVLVRVSSDKGDKMKVNSTLEIHPYKTYIIVGGLGGFGLELAKWLVSKGATKLVINSRNGIRTGYQSYCLRNWIEQGVHVTISTDDATVLTGAQSLLTKGAALGGIGGIFNLAMNLHDAIFANQTEETFAIVAKAKVRITNNLDLLSRELAPALDHFVMFSSLSSGRGKGGQTNYGYANSVMHGICEQRKREGLPGLAIQWGPIADVGAVADKAGEDEVNVTGVLQQRMYSCLMLLETLMLQKCAVVTSFVPADKNTNVETNSQEGIVDAVAKILGVKVTSKLPYDSMLADLGLDSFMATEVKQVLKRSFGLLFSAQEVRNLTFSRLVEMSSAGPSNSNSIRFFK